MFIAALFTIARTWKQSKCPTIDEWIKQMWYIYTMEYYSAIKKNKIMPFVATWMDLEIVILMEVSQTEKDKYHDIAYMWNLKKGYIWTYLQNRNRVTDVENKLMGQSQYGGRGGRGVHVSPQLGHRLDAGGGPQCPRRWEEPLRDRVVCGGSKGR